jgi:hypothetical protein
MKHFRKRTGRNETKGVDGVIIVIKIILKEIECELESTGSGQDPAVDCYEEGIGFDVLTAVVMKSSVFWDITPCSSVKVNRHIGETYRLHLQELRVIQGRIQHDAGS